MIRRTALLSGVCLFLIQARSIGQCHVEERQLLKASNGQGDNRFGHAIDLSGEWMIVGAFTSGTAGTVAGEAYMLQRDGASWVER